VEQFGENTIPTVAVYVDKATVTAVQAALKAHGYGSKLGKTGPNKDGVDGDYGPKTAAAVKALQAATGQAQTGQIDQGVLLSLGVSAPTSGAVTATEAASVLADATQKAHQEEALSDASDQLTAAKAKVAAATTPAAKTAAKAQLQIAQTQFNAAQPNFLLREVPGVERPVWQVGLAGLGILAVTVGTYTLLGRGHGGKSRRRRA